MAAPVKDGKVWRHRIMVKGRRISGTFPTKAHALAWEAEQRIALTGGVKAAANLTCADAFDKYAKEVSPSKRGGKWEANRLKFLAGCKFGKTTLGKVPISEIDASHIASWRDERLKEVAGSTINRDLNLLSHVFTVARKEWKWLASSPTTDVRRPKNPPHRDRRITETEIEALLIRMGYAEGTAPRTVYHRVALVFLFAIETAMRGAEICSLTPDRVEGRVAHLPMTKNGFARNVPLSDKAVKIWELVKKDGGFGLTPGRLSAMFRKARDGAGLPDLNFHDTRHEAITRLARKIPILDLARMTGHRDLKMLMVYYNATAEQIADLL